MLVSCRIIPTIQWGSSQDIWYTRYQVLGNLFPIKIGSINRVVFATPSARWQTLKNNETHGGDRSEFRLKRWKNQ